MELPTVEIFCFGTMKKKPLSGVVFGGYAAVLVQGERTKIISGSQLNATNYVMDITAITKSLSLLKVECKVKIYSSNQIVVNTINFDLPMKTYPHLKPALVKAMELHQIEATLTDLTTVYPYLDIAKKEAQKERIQLEKTTI